MGLAKAIAIGLNTSTVRTRWELSIYTMVLKAKQEKWSEAFLTELFLSVPK